MIRFSICAFSPASMAKDQKSPINDGKIWSAEAKQSILAMEIPEVKANSHTEGDNLGKTLMDESNAKGMVYGLVIACICTSFGYPLSNTLILDKFS